MKIDGSVSKSGSPIYFIPQLLKPIKDKHILSPFQMKIKALLKKMLGKKKKGKNKKTKKKGGGKSKYNIKMARKFRRTRRKRGSGPGGGDNKQSKKQSDIIFERYQKELKEANDLHRKYYDPEGKDPSVTKEMVDAAFKQARDTNISHDKALAYEKTQRAKQDDASGPGGGRKKRRRRTKKRKSRRRKKRSRRRRRKKR